RRVEAVGDPLPKRGLGGKMLRKMNRIAVAGELREADHVGRGNGLAQPLGHADREVFEEEHAQRRQVHARIAPASAAQASRCGRARALRLVWTPSASSNLAKSVLLLRWGAGRAVGLVLVGHALLHECVARSAL